MISFSKTRSYLPRILVEWRVEVEIENFVMMPVWFHKNIKFRMWCAAAQFMIYSEEIGRMPINWNFLTEIRIIITKKPVGKVQSKKKVNRKVKFWSSFDKTHTVCGPWFIQFWDFRISFFALQFNLFFSLWCSKLISTVQLRNEIIFFFCLWAFKMRAHDICVCWLSVFFFSQELNRNSQYGWYHESKSQPEFKKKKRFPEYFCSSTHINRILFVLSGRQKKIVCHTSCDGNMNWR